MRARRKRDVSRQRTHTSIPFTSIRLFAQSKFIHILAMLFASIDEYRLPVGFECGGDTRRKNVAVENDLNGNAWLARPPTFSM